MYPKEERYTVSFAAVRKVLDKSPASVCLCVCTNVWPLDDGADVETANRSTDRGGTNGQHLPFCQSGARLLSEALPLNLLWLEMIKLNQSLAPFRVPV